MSSGPAEDPRLAAAAAPTGRQLRRGVGAGIASQLILRAGTLVLGIVTARLLSPAEYGAYAVALTALLLLLALNDLGLIIGLSRWPGALDRVAPTAVTLVLAGSTLAVLGAQVAAGPFAAALGEPAAAGVVRLISLVLLVDAVSAVPSALLLRSYRAGVRLVSESLGLAVNAALTLSLAVGGAGAVSIAAGRLGGSVVSAAVVIIRSPARPLPGFDRVAARALLGFGLPLAAAGLVEAAVLSVDYVVVGRVLGAVALGTYLLAFNAASVPFTVLGPALQRITVPAFSAWHREPGQLGRRLATAVLLVAVLVGLVTGGLVALARPLVLTVYGQKWAAAAGPLAVLALLGGLRVLLGLLSDTLVSTGSARAVLRLRVVWLAALVPALVVGTRTDGLRGTAIAHVLVAVAVVLPVALLAVRRQASITSAPLLLAALPGVLVGLAAGGAAALAAGVSGGPPAQQLLMGSVAGGLAGTAVGLGVPAVRSGVRSLRSRAGRGPAGSPSPGSGSADPAGS